MPALEAWDMRETTEEIEEEHPMKQEENQEGVSEDSESRRVRTVLNAVDWSCKVGIRTDLLI